MPLVDAVRQAIEQALFGETFDAWKQGLLSNAARWTSGLKDALAIVIVAWVLSGLLYALESKAEAKMTRTILYILALSRLLGAIVGRG